MPYFSFYMAYLIQNAENQRFKSPLLPYQSILYLCLPTKKSELKSPEMVDAPEFSQAHLYRLVNMVAGAGITSYVRQLRASELLPPQTYFRSFSKLLRRCFPVLVQALLASSNSSQKLFSAGISVTAVSQIISRLMLP